MWTDRYHAAGFQQMKIYSSVKLEELKVVADEAHRLGMTVTGHVPEGIERLSGHRSRARPDQPHPLHRRHHEGAAAARTPPGSTARRPARTSISNSPEAQKAIAFLKASSHRRRSHHGAVSEFFTATTAKPPPALSPASTKSRQNSPQQLTDVGPPDGAFGDRRKSISRRNWPSSAHCIAPEFRSSPAPIRPSPATACTAKSNCTCRPDSLPWKRSRPRPSSPRARWASTKNPAPSRKASAAT